MARRWSAVLARIGRPTGDKRIIAPGALTHRDLPLPLMWQRVSGEGHGGSVTVGAIEQLTIDNENGVVTGSGRFLDVRGAEDAARQVDAGVTGPSADLFDDLDIIEVQKLIEAGVIGPDVTQNMDDLTYVVDDDNMIVITSARIAGATLVQIPAFAEVHIVMDPDDVSRETFDRPCDPATEDCSPITNYALVASVRSSGWSDMPIADESRDWDGDAAAGRVFSWATDGDTTDWSRYARAFLRKDDDADPETKGAYSFGIADVIDGTLTIVPRGVFAAAAAAAVQGARTGSEPEEADAMRSVLNGIYSRMDREPPWGDMSLVAAADVSRETLPPLEWFARPQFDGPTPLTVTDEGRVFGHIAPWGQCHVGLPGCTTAPPSYTEYAHFLRKHQMTSDGVKVPTGIITVGGGHADTSFGMVPAMGHYDNPDWATAKVFAGEDEFGIWVAGWILPYADPVKVQQLKDIDVSGDWRQAGGNLELMGLAAVVEPGFPVLRKVHFSMSKGGQQTLIGRFKVTAPTIEASDVSRETSTDDARARWRWANRKEV